jgi:ELWxxDGT repeat protein
VVLGDLYLFITTDNVHGRELWKSDGTKAGTVMVKDISSGSSDGVPGATLVVMGDHVYFPAYDETKGSELWKSDGTEEGTVMVADLESTSSDPNDLVAVGDSLYFIAGLVGQRSLYVTDGSEAGTVELVRVGIGRECAGVGSVAYCSLSDTDHPLELIYKSDGTVDGTVPVAPNIQEESPFGLKALGNKLLFYAYDSEHGTELWRTDGTEAGTAMVKDCAPGTRSGVGSQLEGNDVVFDGGFLFDADGGQGSYMWITDGTEAGTTPVGQPPGVSGALDFRWLTSRGPDVVFKGNEGVNGRELWKTDGTAAGTAIVKDINPGRDSALDAEANDLTIAGNLIFFVADDGTHGYQVWRSAGTAANTVRLTNFSPSFERNIEPKHLRALGTRLLFWADDGAPGAKLWSIDLDAPPISDTATGGTGGSANTTGGTGGANASGGVGGSLGGSNQGGSGDDGGTDGDAAGGTGGTGGTSSSKGGSGGAAQGGTSGAGRGAGGASSVSGAAGRGPADASSKDASACGCRTAATTPRSASANAVFLSLALLALRRRARRPQRR